MATPSRSAMHPQKSFFLDSLPAELRLNIYELLIVSANPLRSPTTRSPSSGLDLTILRINHQIHKEAKAIFMGKNTFLISRLTEADGGLNAQGTGANNAFAFTPPIKKDDWPMLRHLTIDLLCYPLVPTDEQSTGTRKPMHAGVAAFISSLPPLLTSPTPLQTLTLHASIPTSTPSDPASRAPTRETLLSFLALEQNRTTISTIASLPLAALTITFDFADSYYSVDVPPGTLADRSLFTLASWVVFCRGEVLVRRCVRGLGGGEEDEDGGVDEGEREGEEIGGEKKIDLAPFLQGVWPGGGGAGGGVVE